jgi:sugar O-acyltransferase (sialic acid O-acetyltransferase NeuD family)
MAKPKLLIIGAGGHGQSVAEAAELSGQFYVVGFLDDALAVGTLVLGYPVLGSAVDLTGYALVYDQVLVAIGNNALRASLVDRLVQAGLSLATVVHPKAMVSPCAQVGAGTAVMAGAIVGTAALLGQGVIVNCGAVVDHHARVEDFGHLGVGACMAGGSVLGAKAWMQAGSALGYGVTIPAETVLKPGEALGAKTNNQNYEKFDQ